MVSVVLEVTEFVTNVTQHPVIPGVDLKNKEASVILTLDCNPLHPSKKNPSCFFQCCKCRQL